MLTIIAQEIVKFTASARLGIHKKLQCCRLTDVARQISNSKGDEEDEEKEESKA